jgi:ABC-type transporter Mla subunit MlaD
MQNASQAGDGIKISELSKSIHDSQAAINNLFDNLEKLTNNLEKQESLFEKKLNNLNNDLRL